MLSANGLYGHIRNNALKSALLLAGFVVLMVLFWYSWCIIYTAVCDAWLTPRYSGHRRGATHDTITVLGILTQALHLAAKRWWLPLVFSAGWFAIAYAIHAQIIAIATGARPVTRQEAPKLYNAVENLAITAGLPMPRVEIIRSDALNAYASGLGQKDACITVTSGLMRALTDAELEAVIAHEMTHIKNCDVRLMIVATVFAGGLTLLGDGVARLFSNGDVSGGDIAYGLSRGGRDSDGNGAIVSVLISLAIAILFLALTHLFSLMIKFAISRAREFMADAGAIELTKNPDALISALQKISGNDVIPGVNTNLQAMMISSSVESLFSTHPPISTRIMALQQYAGGRVSMQPRRPARVTNGTASASPSAPAGAPVGAMGFAGGRATFGRRGLA